MTNVHTPNWINAKTITIFILAVIIGYFLTTSIVANRFQEIELTNRVLIVDQEKLLAAIAERTANNGADVVTEKIIRDCTVSERTDFDRLLSNIETLSYTQLVELERLFGRCGNFFAERKAVMVARLAREVEVYEKFVKQLSVVIGSDQTAEFPLAAWQQLAAEEQKLSEGLAELVRYQDQIITALLEGKTAVSPEVRDILFQVNETNEQLRLANTQSSRIRSELVDL